MSSFAIKWICNRFLKDNQLTKFGVEDPYYLHVQVGTDSHNKPKYKKVRRENPAGISQHDLRVLSDVKQQAFRYDMWFNVFGLRVGLSSLVGLVPVVGLLITNYWSISLFLKARSLEDGLPLDIQLIFLFNILVDFLLSLIPIVGDIIEVGYKANLRNFLLLEKHLVRVGERNLGLRDPADVRPGFLNDKVQPYVDDTLVPQAVEAGQSIRRFVKDNFKAKDKPDKTTTASSPTTQSLQATAVGTVDTLYDDDSHSIRSFISLKEQ